MEESTEGKIEPELGELELSSADTGFEAPGQQCLSNWKMERTSVDGCSLVDGSSDLGGKAFSLEGLATGMQTGSKTLTSFASSKTFVKR